MKAYFFTIVFLFVATNITLAQNEDRPIRYADPDADKFIGIWKHDSAGYSITITFKKGKVAGSFEQLFGTYRIQRNGRIGCNPR